MELPIFEQVVSNFDSYILHAIVYPVHFKFLIEFFLQLVDGILI